MAKFKGGLYADLSNYNTSLPNTEVLLNFFKSNPVGYRSGGMVQGIAGGNPTGMRVTGGFLANAQRFAQGTDPYDPTQYYQTATGDMAKSAYYRDKDVSFSPLPKKKLNNQELEKLGILKKVPKYKESISKKTGKKVKRQVGWEYVPTGETYIPPKDYYDQTPPLREKFPEVTEQLTSTEMMETPMSDNDAKLLQEISRLRAKKDEGYEAQIQQILALPESEGGISEFTKKQMALGTAKPDVVEQEDTGIKSLDRGKKDPSEQSLGVSAFVPKSEEQKLQEELDKIKKPDQETSVTEGLSVDDLKVEETDAIKTTEKDTSTEKENVAVGGHTKKLYNMTEEDWLKKFQSMSNQDEKQISSDDDKLSKKIAQALNPDAKDKGKEAPAWAMPLMMAGLQMAASNNPDMLGALGEGGIKGLEEYARIQKEKREDQKYEQEMALKKAGLIFDQERIKISKNQLKLTEQAQNYNIVSDAMKSFNNIQLEYDKMLQTDQWNQEEYRFKWGSMHQTAELEANRLAHDLLKFKASHKLDIAKLSLEEQKTANAWYETEMGLALKKGLYDSQILANNASAKAAGFKMGTVEKLKIGGKDIQVQIWRDKDGFHMQELGEAADTTQSRLLKDFMSSNPFWYDEYQTDPDAFFEKLEAVKEMSDILTDENKDIDLTGIEKQ